MGRQESASKSHSSKRSRNRATSRTNVLGAKRLCSLASSHGHRIRGHWCWLRRCCCNDGRRKHRWEVAQTIRRRRCNCLTSGSSIGRSTKEPFCRALDHEFRSTSVIGTREEGGQFQLDCGQ